MHPQLSNRRDYLRRASPVLPLSTDLYRPGCFAVLPRIQQRSRFGPTKATEDDHIVIVFARHRVTRQDHAGMEALCLACCVLFNYTPLAVTMHKGAPTGSSEAPLVFIWPQWGHFFCSKTHSASNILRIASFCSGSNKSSFAARDETRA